jgi:hypothetical protein
MVRSLEQGTVEQRVCSWVERLTTHAANPVTAVDLYGGDHWTVARTLPSVAARNGPSAELWVLSAGYGLIRATHRIQPYSATFSQASPDCVGVGIEASRWWRALAASSLGETEHRSITDLARRHPESTFLIVASTRYLRPLADDVRNAAEALRSSGQMMIVSAGLKLSDQSLGPHALPVDARMTHLVDGSRVSLNARIAGFLLSEGLVPRFGIDDVAREMRAFQAQLPNPPQFSRLPMSDGDVRAYVATELTNEPSASASRLLRRLRDSGRACEQERFHAIYRDVTRIG